MDLKEINERYEKIILSNTPQDEKDKQLAGLMSEMETDFNIPMLRRPEWERENRSVIALYRKIANSRKL
uniref:Uncharacterized protein n=1 Tax=Heyndrickxia coagulans TaxID=1398 RepID=A0FJY0_HEYCO|nr:hypothetical protein [Heyndrickxia coagulans]ABJ99985.1 hypothetical protein [Heyndrickxia coagulans]